MYYTAINILKSAHLAEEAVQQAFERIIRQQVERKITDPYCKKTRYFLIAIVRNVCFDLYKKRNHQQAAASIDNFEDSLISLDQNPLDFILSEELLQQIQNSIKKLPPIYVDILFLNRIYEYSDQEIASMIGISNGVVRVRLYRGIILLREILQKEGGN